jgi:hypothetical protein
VDHHRRPASVLLLWIRLRLWMQRQQRLQLLLLKAYIRKTGRFGVPFYAAFRGQAHRISCTLL